MKKLFWILTMVVLLCLATVSSVAAADMTAPVGLRYVPHAADRHLPAVYQLGRHIAAGIYGKYGCNAEHFKTFC